MNRAFERYLSYGDYFRWKGWKLKIENVKGLLCVKYIFD